MDNTFFSYSDCMLLSTELFSCQSFIDHSENTGITYSFVLAYLFSLLLQLFCFSIFLAFSSTVVFILK